ncbi:hypothetical protein G7Z17_g8010 [Cylindrodendrum hubeiense]|uniref:Uncharacterized protein n=1 Tax=Cylindrodendrum hubeiense TaxID=595255 RepID=A0A9P5H4I4_9HYPO|nr:hypothetical protein G7Z17_g8010 [Cylindrodendrum hubeiense]
MSLSTWALPIELIRHVGLLLLPEEPYTTSPISFHSSDFLGNNRALRALTYSCRSTRTILEPLLFRFVLMTDAADITHFFLLLAQNPRLRQFVRHIACISPLDWNGRPGRSESRLRAWKMWETRYGLEMSAKDIVEEAGFELDYGATTNGFSEVVRNMDTGFLLDDLVKFMFGCVLMMAPETETFFFRRWLSYEETNPANVVGNILMEAVSDKGYPVMPKLRVLELGTKHDEPLGDTIEMFFWKPDMWKSLRTLILNDVDFDDQFFQLLVEGSFDFELPVEELYIRSKVPAYPATLSDSVDDTADDTEWDVSFEQILEMLEIDVQPAYQVFCNLRLLDIDFPPSPRRVGSGSRILKVFLAAIGGAPETLRLTCHPFPTRVLETAVQTRLKVLVVKECTDMPEVPSADQMAKAMHTLFYEGEFCLPNLDWVQVNGVRKEKQVFVS